MSRTIDESRLEKLITALCADECEATIRALANIFVEKAAAAKEPAKSVVKTVPIYLRGRVGKQQYDRVYRAALGMAYDLKAGRTEAVAGSVGDGEWMSTACLARRMGERRATIEALLMTDPEFRCQCGWPMHFLGEWRIPAAAFDERQARYRASLPAREPHVVPEGCTPQSPTSAPARECPQEVK
jgi:hypothetical protein